MLASASCTLVVWTKDSVSRPFVRVGNRRFALSLVWWYVLRLFIGVALAVVFYCAVRGGFLSTEAGSQDLNPYGVAALAALVGCATG